MDKKKLTLAQIDALLEDLELKKITLNVLNEQLDALIGDLKGVRYLATFIEEASRGKE